MPVLGIVSILIALIDGFPVFFKQVRIGKNGIPFNVYKFRTMRQSPDQNTKLATDKDTRITKLGHFLRHYKMDELPQLWNILRGDMSFVGYRPEIPFYVNRYTDWQREILKYKPGIVDPATLIFSRYENKRLAFSTNIEKDYIEKILPRKIRISLKYAQNANFCTDLCCILKCIRRIFS